MIHSFSFSQSPLPTTNRRYEHAALLRYTYEYSCSEQSRNVFLRAFFDSINLPLDGDANFTCQQLEAVHAHFVGFADHLIDHFFLSRKTCSGFSSVLL